MSTGTLERFERNPSGLREAWRVIEQRPSDLLQETLRWGIDGRWAIDGACPPSVPALRALPAAPAGAVPVPRRSGRRVVARVLAPVRLAVKLTTGLISLAVGLLVVGSLLGTWGLVPVLTGSMRPGVQPGDLVLVMPEPVSQVRAGQVIVFQPPGEGGATVVHRVIKVTPGAGGPSIHTKGDANNVADSWKVQLTGPRAWRVRAVLPKLGFVSVAEHNPKTRLILEGLLVASGIGTALSVVWGKPRDKRREQITGVPVG